MDRHENIRFHIANIDKVAFSITQITFKEIYQY